jgi:DNA uptake protein ComE-like DNA-binding protein
MIRFCISSLPRLAAGAITPLVLVAFTACSSGSDDAARSDTAAAAAASATSAPNLPATTPAGAMDSAGAAGATTSAAGASAAGGTATSGAMLDPNTATRDQLVAVPGMTAAAADALIAGRPYQSMVAVDQALKSLGADARKTVYARVWRPIDLNTAKGEEILLIPGVGPKMRHEFEEYRPYTSMEQFRREIGKYVDKNEVARLEQYVTIR